MENVGNSVVRGLIFIKLKIFKLKIIPFKYLQLYVKLLTIGIGRLGVQIQNRFEQQQRNVGSAVIFISSSLEK